MMSVCWRKRTSLLGFRSSISCLTGRSYHRIVGGSLVNNISVRNEKEFCTTSTSSSDRGKAAFINALRSSFVVTAKNTRSEARRQAESFSKVFNDPKVNRLITTAVIEETFWTMIEGGETYPITRAITLLPPDLWSNSILNAGILAFGRSNRPLKGYELLQSFVAVKLENRQHRGISLKQTAVAATLEYALQAFCESDRLEQVEEILAQWILLCRKEREEYVEKMMNSGNASNTGEGGRRDAVDVEVEMRRIDSLIPAFASRVNLSRQKMKTEADKLNNPEGEEVVTEVKERKKLSAGVEISFRKYVDLMETHAFEENIAFSREQALLTHSLKNDTFLDWEHSFDEEHSVSKEPSSHSSILVEPDAKSIINIRSLFYSDDLVDSEFEEEEEEGNEEEEEEENGDIADSRTKSDNSSTPFLPLLSDLALCVVVRMYAGRGAWDSCLSVCQSMLIKQHNTLSSSTSSSTSTSGAMKALGDVESKEDQGSARETNTNELEKENGDDYARSVNSPLAICYRQTLQALCSNGQFNAAFLLTRQVRTVGVRVTASSLAQLLLMFEVNEDLSQVRLKNGDEEEKEGEGNVTLLDFQEEILQACVASAHHDRRILESDDLAGFNRGGLPKGYHTQQSFERDNDYNSAEALIDVNVRLLCERGLVFAAEKMLIDLHHAGAGSSVPPQAMAALSGYLAGRDQFKRSQLFYDYLTRISKENPDVGGEMSVKDTILYGRRRRRVSVAAALLPEVYHAICNEHRRANNLEGLVDFMFEYAPKSV